MSLLHDLVNVLHNIAHASPQAKGGGKDPVSQAGASNNTPGRGLGQPSYPSDPGFPLQGQGARPDTTYSPNPGPYSSNNMALVEALAKRPFYTPLQQPGSLPYGGLQGGHDLAAQPLRPGQIPFNMSNFRDTQIRL